MGIEKLKLEFYKWSGFNLEAETLEDALSEIKTRLWDLQCELDQQATSLEKLAISVFPKDA